MKHGKESRRKSARKTRTREQIHSEKNINKSGQKSVTKNKVLEREKRVEQAKQIHSHIKYTHGIKSGPTSREKTHHKSAHARKHPTKKPRTKVAIIDNQKQGLRGGKTRRKTTTNTQAFT